jgi:lysozyme
VTVLLVDLSNNNPSVDFRRVAAAGVTAVYLKASEGSTFQDHTYRPRAIAARAAGLRVGAYHFARQGPVAAEAGNFCAVVAELDRRDLRPALDVETAPGRTWVDWSRAWNRAVQAELGALPIFYTYPAFADALHADKPIGAGLWLASFGRNDGKEHPYSVPAPWRRTVAHQFTSRARVAGVSGECDLSSAGSLRPLLAHPITGRL